MSDTQDLGFDHESELEEPIEEHTEEQLKAMSAYRNGWQWERNGRSVFNLKMTQRTWFQFDTRNKLSSAQSCLQTPRLKTM